MHKSDHKIILQSFLVLKLASDIWSFNARFTPGNFSMKHNFLNSFPQIL